MPSMGGGPHNGPSKERAKNTKKTLKELLSYLKDYKLRLALVVLCTIGSTVFAIIGPKLLGNITTEIFNGLMKKITNTGSIDFSLISKIAIMTIVLYVVSSILSAFQGVIMAKISTNISYKLRNKINHKINLLPMKFFDTKTHGEVLSIITNDVDTFASSLEQSVSTIITSIATIIGVLIMMISINIPMTLVGLLIVPVCMYIVNKIARHGQKYFFQQQEYLGNINGHVEEVYGGHDIVKSFNAEDKVTKEFNEINDKLYNSAWKSQFFGTSMFPITKFVGQLGYVCISILGGYMVILEKIEVGEIQSFTQYIKRFTNSIDDLSQVANNVQSALAAAERVFDFLELEEEKEIQNSDLDIDQIKGNIEFRNVKFGYNPDKIIINDFSAKIKAGQKIAIVGPTGAGKTTIVKLLMRFYDLNSGTILIDGKDASKYNRHLIRSMFGMVLQDTWLFNGTINDNIRYGKLDATDLEIQEACKITNVDHFIRTLPEGYNLVLNEEADNISGGQKQLLTIARVILADPKILILDEATSSVDTRTEILIQEAMDKLMENRTSFIIAHRLSTIKNADLILAMNNGDIVEQGTHEELLKKNGFYANLYNSQFDVEEE
ncbi:MAG: ABC transporter ATP-binding protein/permease [Tenericutes bacterium]|nr:ABC transporter ATP-binding protein/permease [Mycoplasmatota bacterium]